MIAFVPLREEDLGLMQSWLSEGESGRWYGLGQPTDLATLRQKFLVDHPADGTQGFVIAYDGDQIGYLQYYRAADYPEWYSLVGALPGDYGLDLMIGDDELLGEGIGTAVMKQALAELVFSQQDAARCVLGPSPDNHRAIRCYEKCGFQHLRTVQAPEGEAEYVMAVARPRRAEVEVAKPHRSKYPKPAEFRRGERVATGRKDDEFPGWVWIRTTDGNEGWAPELCLEPIDEGLAIGREDYSAKELDTELGDSLEILRELAGWVWCRNREGAEGWVPVKTLFGGADAR